MRLGLLALALLLLSQNFGGLSLARGAFDDDFRDCPAKSRLPAVSGLTVNRTDEEDEIRVAWDAPDLNGLASHLGSDALKARMTIIVDGDGEEITKQEALGENSLVIDGIQPTLDLTVSVGITLGGYVVSDIRSVDYTSGMPAPCFATGVWSVGAVDTADGAITLAAGQSHGLYYYLGFNDLFDNWWVEGEATPVANRPESQKFRIGLRHGAGDVTPSDVDFAYYRIAIEDSEGDLLGYQAETVSGQSVYDSRIVFGQHGPVGGNRSVSLLNRWDLEIPGSSPAANRFFTNIRLSDQVAARSESPSYYTVNSLSALAPDNAGTALAFANVEGVIGAQNGTHLDLGVLFSDPPQEYSNFPLDVFDNDGTYTVRAWAEDEDGNRISPQALIEVNIQEGQRRTTSSYGGYIPYPAGVDVRRWSTTGTALRVYSLSVQQDDTANISSGGGDCASPPPATVTAPPPLPRLEAPPTPQVSAVTDTSVTLGWTYDSAAARLEDFLIQQCATGECSNPATSATPAAGDTSTTITGLSPNATYYFRIQARAATVSVTHRDSLFSDIISATTERTKLDIPSNLTAPTITSSSVTLTWAYAGGAAELGDFLLQQCPTGACSSPSTAATLAAGDRSTTITGLSPNTTYYFRIQARAASNSATHQDSNFSTPISVTTPRTTLAVPGSFLSTVTTGITATFTWTYDSSATGLGDFLIQQCATATCSTPTTAATPAAGDTSATITGLSPITTYYFRIQARAASGSLTHQDSSFSTPISITTPVNKLAVPGSFQSTAITATSATFSWTYDSGAVGLDDFLIQSCPTAACLNPTTAFTPLAGTNAATVTGLTSGTTYYFRIQARAPVGSTEHEDSDFSPVVSVTTP